MIKDINTMSVHCNSESLKNILHSCDLRLTFISNPKVACSTIKNSLLGGFEGDVHKEANRRFALPNDTEHDFFCLTRNPYSRALSCFKNKIGPLKEKNPNAVWHPFCKRFGFNRNTQPSFEDFLRALLEDNDPFTMDMHYRCQYINLHHDNIKPAFIGRIERFDDIEKYLLKKQVKIIPRNRHKTNAIETYKDEINEIEANLINKIYYKDFEIFGYRNKVNDKFIPISINQTQKISEEYKKLFASNQHAT